MHSYSPASPFERLENFTSYKCPICNTESERGESHPCGECEALVCRKCYQNMYTPSGWNIVCKNCCASPMICGRCMYVYSEEYSKSQKSKCPYCHRKLRKHTGEK